MTSKWTLTPDTPPGGGGGTGGIGGTDGGDGRDGQKGAGGKGQGVKVGEVQLQHFVLFPGKGGQPTGQDQGSINFSLSDLVFWTVKKYKEGNRDNFYLRSNLEKNTSKIL